MTYQIAATGIAMKTATGKIELLVRGPIGFTRYVDQADRPEEIEWIPMIGIDQMYEVLQFVGFEL